MRLNRFLATAGIASRRKVEDLVAAGRVTVNGAKADHPGRLVDPDADDVRLDGARLRLPAKRVTILLHKPAGVLSTASDPMRRKTVVDLVPRELGRLYPVGRLDLDVSGILLLTTDGELANRLLHPRFGVEKTYEAEVGSPPTEAALERLRKGVALEDGRTAPAAVRRIAATAYRGATIEIRIHEGRKRQVKRMFAAVGFPVVRLRRVRFGNLALGSTAPGRYRVLADREVESLLRLTKETSEAE